MNARPVKRFSFVLFLSHVFKRLRAEKLLSGVAVDTGWVAKICRSLCIIGRALLSHNFIDEITSSGTIRLELLSMVAFHCWCQMSHSLQHRLISLQFESWRHSGKIPRQNSHNSLISPCNSEGLILRSIEEGTNKPSFMAFLR